MKAELIYSHFVKSDLKEIHAWYKKLIKSYRINLRKNFNQR